MIQPTVFITENEDAEGISLLKSEICHCTNHICKTLNANHLLLTIYSL